MHGELKRNLEAHKLTTASKILGYPWLAVMILADTLFNIFIGTFLFMELPREALFTARLERMLDIYQPVVRWRFKVAKYICSNLLDPFDPDGRHCK